MGIPDAIFDYLNYKLPALFLSPCVCVHACVTQFPLKLLQLHIFGKLFDDVFTKCYNEYAVTSNQRLFRFNFFVNGFLPVNAHTVNNILNLNSINTIMLYSSTTKLS